MVPFDLYGLQQDLERRSIMFCYSGPILQSTIEGIGQTLRLDLRIEAAGQSTAQAVFSVFIEQMQNVLNYSSDRISADPGLNKELRTGVLVIGRAEGGFYIYCGNKVLAEDVPRLQGRIGELAGLDKDQLKALYRERRRMEPEPGARRGGLGLIEMARKAGRPLAHRFTPIDERSSFFSIMVTVAGN